jgi:hypothetical protein
MFKFKQKVRSGPSILIVLIPLAACAQSISNSGVTLAAPSISEKWECLRTRQSQITRSAPLYGRHPWPTAYPKRFGASIADIVSQNFWGDFVLASAFHEDTRYRRKGESQKLWPRVGYAVSRSVVTRRDAGGPIFSHLPLPFVPAWRELPNLAETLRIAGAPTRLRSWPCQDQTGHGRAQGSSKLYFCC